MGNCSCQTFCVGDKYDLWIFTELADYMKYEVLDNHEIILCNDEPYLYELFRPYLKSKEDYEIRLKNIE